MGFGLPPLASASSALSLGHTATLVGVAAAGTVLTALTCWWRTLHWTWPLIAAGAATLVLVPIAGTDAVATWLPLASGMLAAALLARWHADDRRRGGDIRRRADGAYTALDAVHSLIERRRLARGGLTTGDAFVIGVAAKRRPAWIELGTSAGRHGLFLGATGSGKTNALVWSFCAHLHGGFAGVFIDLKASRAVRDRLLVEAETCGRPFYEWTLEGGQHWNPLAHGSANELADRLFSTQAFTEPHYAAMYRRYLLALFRCLRGREATLADVARLLDPDELLVELRDLDDEELADQIGRYLQGLSNDQRRELGGLADRLAVLIETGAGEWLLPTSDPAESLDFRAALPAGAVVYVGLDSSRYPDLARLIGTLLLQELKALCGAVEHGTVPSRPGMVALDEFSALDQDHVVGLFQRARSARMSVLLATQELSDMRRVARGLEDQLLGNVEYVVAGRQNVPDSAELLARTAGTNERWEHTFQTDHRPGKNRAAWGESGLGSKRLVREFLYGPDEFKQLRVGEAILIEKNPHRVERVHVVDALSAADLLPEAMTIEDLADSAAGARAATGSTGTIHEEVRGELTPSKR